MDGHGRARRRHLQPLRAGGPYLPELIDLIDRFGPEIEYDLHAELQLDLLDFFRGKYTWRKLLSLLGLLPATSRFHSARALDLDLAREALEQEVEAGEGGGKEPWTPPPTEWDVKTELLAEIRDRLGDVVRAQLSSIPVEKGKSRPKYRDKPFPRPVMAMEKAREEAAREGAQLLIAWFSPHAVDDV